VLVNNAGIYGFEPLENVTEEEVHREFNTNVLGPILTIQEALKHFGPDGGSVINISSVASEAAPPNSVVYSATKGAVDTISRVLGKELGARNIRVNTIAPGGVETEGVHSAGIIGSDFEKRMVADTPLGRLGQPDDIAGVAVFLASDLGAMADGREDYRVRRVALTSTGRRCSCVALLLHRRNLQPPVAGRGCFTRSAQSPGLHGRNWRLRGLF
jgi:3-oxoacyl-[acyl-carrier protein] reductase